MLTQRIDVIRQAWKAADSLAMGIASLVRQIFGSHKPYLSVYLTTLMHLKPGKTGIHNRLQPSWTPYTTRSAAGERRLRVKH